MMQVSPGFGNLVLVDIEGKGGFSKQQAFPGISKLLVRLYFTVFFILYFNRSVDPLRKIVSEKIIRKN